MLARLAVTGVATVGYFVARNRPGHYSEHLRDAERGPTFLLLVALLVATVWAWQTRRLGPTLVVSAVTAVLVENWWRTTILTLSPPIQSSLEAVLFQSAIVLLGASSLLELLAVVPLFRWARAHLPPRARPLDRGEPAL